jgi:amino acid transporter/nucleotide-binding universal stress UspA family protein
MAAEVRLSREMRLIDVTMIGVGAMIGAGIFVLTGIAAGVAGPALVLVFLLNGLVALLTAMAYAELGGAIHGAGGGYLWIKQSLPDPSGFLSGWMDWFAHAVACSLYALGFGAYFKEVLGVLGIHGIVTPFAPFEVWLAVGACIVFAVINLRGASEAGKAGNVVTIGKIVIIGAFISVGLWTMAQKTGWQGSFSPFMTSGLGGVFAAMGLTFIAFEGYEIIAQTSEEVEDPKRNVPKAIFLSMLIVIPIYLLVAVVAIGAVTPPEGMSVTQYLGQEKEIALVAAADQFVVGGGIVILVGGLLSTVSALNATIYSSSRVAFAMARDASLPKAMAAVHPKRGTPHISIIVSAALIIFMAVVLPIEDVAAAASVMFLLLFGGVNVALIRLRTQRPDLDRGYKVPLVPFTPIVAIIAMLFIAVFMFKGYPLAWAAAGGWIVLGWIFYSVYSKKREKAFQRRSTWMEKIDRDEYRVLVGVSSESRMPTLMEAALAIARTQQGEVVVLHVVEVAEGEALSTERPVPAAANRVLDAAVRYAATRGVTARAVVRIGHRVSHALVQTAREEACNFMVIGQAAQPSFIERLVSSIVERVLREAPCHVAIVSGTIRPGEVAGVLVPVTPSPNSELAARLAPAFAAWFEAPARAITVIDRELTDADAERVEEETRTLVGAAAAQAPLQVLRRGEPSRAITRAVKPDEVVVIGAPSTGPLTPLFGETIPTLLARHDRNAVIVVRKVQQQQAHLFDRVFFSRN